MARIKTTRTKRPVKTNEPIEKVPKSPEKAGPSKIKKSNYRLLAEKAAMKHGIRTAEEITEPECPRFS